MKYHFRENEEVAHMDNLDIKMVVKKVRYKSPGPGEDKKAKKRKIDGILCYWWEDSKLREYMFHAEKLVPWMVATQGMVKSTLWLKEMGAKAYSESYEGS